MFNMHPTLHKTVLQARVSPTTTHIPTVRPAYVTLRFWDGAVADDAVLVLPFRSFLSWPEDAGRFPTLRLSQPMMPVTNTPTHDTHTQGDAPRVTRDTRKGVPPRDTATDGLQGPKTQTRSRTSVALPVQLQL
jgi:hypothetical protein